MNTLYHQRVNVSDDARCGSTMGIVVDDPRRVTCPDCALLMLVNGGTVYAYFHGHLLVGTRGTP